MVTEGFRFRLQDCHLLWWPYSMTFSYRCLCNSSRLPQPRPEGRFGLYPRSLAATDGVSVDFLSSRY